MDSLLPTPLRIPRKGPPAATARALAEEAAVAIVYNGTTHAVLMATPADLADLGRGFTLTEGIAAPHEIESVEVAHHPHGREVRLWLRGDAAARVATRRRALTGPTGCGLCGVESLEAAVRQPPRVTAALTLTAAQVHAALAALPAHQPLTRATRAAHAAALWTPAHGIILAREDVGRHNALDKLAGAAQPAGIDPAQALLLLTSRVSVEMVQKAASIGVGILAAVSAPTKLAVATAQAAGLTLIAVARDDGFELFTHPWRLTL